MSQQRLQQRNLARDLNDDKNVNNIITFYFDEENKLVARHKKPVGNRYVDLFTIAPSPTGITTSPPIPEIRNKIGSTKLQALEEVLRRLGNLRPNDDQFPPLWNHALRMLQQQGGGGDSITRTFVDLGRAGISQ